LEALTSNSLMYWSAICTAGGFVLLVVSMTIVAKGKGEAEDFVILFAAIASIWTGLSFFLLVTGLLWHIVLSIIGAFK